MNQTVTEKLAQVEKEIAKVQRKLKEIGQGAYGEWADGGNGMQSNLKKQLDNLITTSKSIAIVTHIRPDHDAICSALALYYYLTKKNITNTVRIMVEGDKNTTWNELENSDKIEWVDDLSTRLEKRDLLILTDTNSWDRATKNSKDIAKHPGKKMCLDHHETEGNDRFYIKHVDKTAAAATQIIAEELLGNLENTPKGILETLLLGIIGDTGKFSFITGKNARVLGTAQKIIEAGNLTVEEISLKFGKIQPQELELTAQLLKNTRFAKIEGKPNIMYSFLEKSILEMDPIVVQNAYHGFLGNYVRRVDSYPWGFVVIPVGRGEYKVSLRAINGGPSVLPTAEYFGGGGHTPAAACSIKAENKTPLEICEKVIQQMKNC
ncbi:MAG: DHH family phosphoesterase [bacterium]